MKHRLNRQIAAALAALGILAALTRYFVERAQEPGGGAWKPYAAAAWAALLLMSVWALTASLLLGVGDVREAHDRAANWHRPADGQGSRARSDVPTGLSMAQRGEQSWGREHADWFAANGWRPGSAQQPRHAASPGATKEIPVVETTAEIAATDDVIPAHWRAPVAPPSQRAYPAEQPPLYVARRGSRLGGVTLDFFERAAVRQEREGMAA